VVVPPPTLSFFFGPLDSGFFFHRAFKLVLGAGGILLSDGSDLSWINFNVHPLPVAIYGSRSPQLSHPLVIQYFLFYPQNDLDFSQQASRKEEERSQPLLDINGYEWRCKHRKENCFSILTIFSLNGPPLLN